MREEKPGATQPSKQGSRTPGLATSLLTWSPLGPAAPPGPCMERRVSIRGAAGPRSCMLPPDACSQSLRECPCRHLSQGPYSITHITWLFNRCL